MKTFITALLMCLIVFFMGCTFHFKASEVEASGSRSQQINLESIDLLVWNNKLPEKP